MIPVIKLHSPTVANLTCFISLFFIPEIITRPKQEIIALNTG